MLNPVQNFRRMMRGGGPERMPFDVTFTPPVIDRMEAARGTRDIVEGMHTDFQPVYPNRFGGKRADWVAAYAARGIAVPEDAQVQSEGIVQVRPAGGTGAAYHFRQLVHTLESIETVAELEALPWPELTPVPRSAYLEPLRRARENGRAVLAGRECTVFENAWYLRGMDRLFGDLMENDPVGNWLLDWFTERSITDMRTFCAMEEVEVIGLGDDIGMQTGMMMSVPFWRQHFKPRLARVIDTIRELRGDSVLIRYHSDGDITDVIPDLLELGVDILNPVQPECMDVPGILRRYRDRCAFWGMIGTQSTLPHGSPADVRAVLHQLADLAREGVRLVASPTHVVEPDVPWENVEALDEIFRIRL